MIKMEQVVIDHIHNGPSNKIANAKTSTPPTHYTRSVCQVTSRAVCPLNLQQPWRDPPASMGKGTGWVTNFISKTGAKIKIIVTNHHVVSNTNNIKVQFPFMGKAEYNCQKLADCPAKDIAIL